MSSNDMSPYAMLPVSLDTGQAKKVAARDDVAAAMIDSPRPDG